MRTSEEMRNLRAELANRRRSTERLATGVGCFIMAIYVLFALFWTGLIAYGVITLIQYLHRH